MKMIPSKLLNIVLVTIFALSFFSIHTAANTSNYETTDASPEYNPWRDLNDDGVINIYDVVMVTGIYGSTGTPINKTALLYNVNDTFTELLSRIDSLNSSLQQSSSQIIRIHEPNEVSVNSSDWKTVATLTWIPKNSSNGLILSAHGWCEAKADGTPWIQFTIFINGEQPDGFTSITGRSYYQYTDIHYWESCTSCVYGFPISSNYTIEYKVRTQPYPHLFFVKNINIIVHVADGVPALNP